MADENVVFFSKRSIAFKLGGIFRPERYFQLEDFRDLLSRQTESVRDHKFHSGMLIHRWFTDRGHFISHLHQTQE